MGTKSGKMKMVKVDGEFCKDHERGIARSTNLEKGRRMGIRARALMID